MTEEQGTEVIDWLSNMYYNQGTQIYYESQIVAYQSWTIFFLCITLVYMVCRRPRGAR